MASARSLGVLAAAALVAAALGSGCGDPAARAERHRTRGEAYLEEGKPAEAVLEFRNALQLQPNDARAHDALARAYLAANQPEKAFWELQETIRLDPGNLDAKLQYGRLLTVGGKAEAEEAVKQADDVLAQDPGRVPALMVKGRALQALGRLDEGRKALEQAVALAPQDTGPLLLLANLALAERNPAAAEASFRKLVEVAPTYASYQTLAGHLATHPGRDAEAEAAYRTALERAEGKDRPKAHIALANFLASRGRGADAERMLEQGIEALDDDLELVYTLARLYQLRGATAEADRILQRAADERPSDPGPLVILSRYRAALGEFDRALEASERALAAAPDEIQTRLQKAELLVDVGARGASPERILEGRRIAEDVLESEGSVPAALLVRGKAELAEGRREDAAKSLRGVIDLQSDWALPHYLLGATLLAGADAEGARPALARALELDPSLVDAQKLLARAHAGLGDTELAVEVARRSLAAGEDPSLRLLIAQSLLRQRKFDDAARELQAVPEAQRSAELWYVLGRVEIFRKDDAAARAHLLRAEAKDPGRFEVLQALLALDQVQGRLAESKQRIEAAARARPDDARLAGLLGQASFRAGDLAAAEASFKRAIELAPGDAGSYARLGAFLASTGRPDEVLPTFEAALERSPNTASLHYALGTMYLAKARTRDAQARYEDAIRLDPKLALAKNDLAYVLAESGGSLDRALDLAQEAKALLPESPLVADTLGYVLLKRNSAGPALGYFQEAVAGMDPDDALLPTVRHHLALAYEATGDVQSAREQVERALVDLGTHSQPPPGGATSVPDPSADLRALLERLRASEG